MYTANDFRQAFADYVEFNRELYSKMSPGSSILGVLGIGQRPGNDPGHEKFYREIASAIKAVCEEGPDPAAAGEIIDAIYEAKDLYSQERISDFVFTAIDGLTIDLIPFLSREKASEVYIRYKKRAPWNTRVPVQRKILAALKAAAEK